MAFTIRFSQWGRLPTDRDAWGDIPQLLVYPHQEAREPSAIINICSLASHALYLRSHYRKEVNFEDGEFKELLRRGLLRYGVQRIEQMLQDGTFPDNPSLNVLSLDVEETDLPLLQALLDEKTCTYQLKEGRDLFCLAADSEDPTLTFQTSSQQRGMTSRPLCLTCNLPDTDYLCSHLLHPRVTCSIEDGPRKRYLSRIPFCDLGHTDRINEPTQCCAGGHSCWERIVEPNVEAPVIPSSPLALPEAFDYLDAVWRNAFGAKQGLLRLTTFTGMAQLIQPCTTRDEFKSRVSDLAAVLKAMTISNDILPPEAHTIQADYTLDRLLACLRAKHLETGDYQACHDAVDILRTINKVRDTEQHPNNRDFSRALDKLGVRLPAQWGDAWDRIRAKTIEALGIIRVKVRMLAFSLTAP